jgi:SAM-dependent methyltransferase
MSRLDAVDVRLTAPGSGVPSDADFARLAAAEDASFWFRGRNALLVDTLRREFPLARNFLEVGCGNGYVLAAVARARPGIRVTGSDLSAAGLEHARRRVPDASLLRADARALPFDSEFDVAGAFDVIEHVAEDDAVLAALRRAVRPGGGVIVTVPQHRWLWSETDRYSGHQRRYSRRELAAKLERAGLRLRWTSSFVTLLLPLMAASRGWQALSSRPYDPGRELRGAGRLDGLLEHAIRLEARAIGRGVRLPAGGSLLAVAERPA